MGETNNYSYKANTNVSMDMTMNMSTTVNMMMVTLNQITVEAASATKAVENLGGAFRKLKDYSATVNKISEGLQGFRGALESAIAPGADLDNSLTALSATTGITGKELKNIEQYAREMAKAFGGTAAGSVETYRELVSQLSPEIAKVPEAMALMGSCVQTTSKMMGNDTTAAAGVLTTAMNQFGVSLENPMQAAQEMGRMMNIMAAAAKEGSAGLPAIKAALEACGGAAKAAGMSFAETNAAIQVLDKAGQKGSEGGAALANVLASLNGIHVLPEGTLAELEAAGVDLGRLQDSSLSLAERLKPLQGVMNDSGLMAKLFGEGCANAAGELIAGIPSIESYTAGIEGTSTAIDQAQMVMDGYSGKMSQVKAYIDDLKISLFNFAGGIMPMLTGVSAFFQGVGSVMAGVNAIAALTETAWAKSIAQKTKELRKSTLEMLNTVKATGLYNIFTPIASLVTKGFTVAIRGIGNAIYSIPIVGWIAAGITLLVTAFKVLWDKCEGFRRIVFSIWEVVKGVFHNIGVVVKSLWENIIQPYFMFWWNLIKTVATGIWSALEWCWGMIISGVSAVGDFLGTLWEGIMSGIASVGEFFSSIWSQITGICSSAVDWMVSVFSMIAEPIKAVFGQVWESIMSGIASVGEFFGSIWSWITGICGSSVDWMVSVFSMIAEPIKAVFGQVWEFVTGIFDKISETVGKFFNWIGGMWNKLFPKDQFKDLGEAAKEGLAKGSESWNKSQDAKKNGGIPEESGVPDLMATTTTTTTPAKQPNRTTMPPLPETAKSPAVQTAANARTQSKASAAGSETIKLNDVKGSTDYAAIAAKTAPVKISGLSADSTSAAGAAINALSNQPGAATGVSPTKQESAAAGQSTNNAGGIATYVQSIAAGVAMLVSLQTMAVDTMKMSAGGQTTVNPNPMAMTDLQSPNPLQPVAGKLQAGTQGAGVNFEKFCESVVIQVAEGTSQDQAEQIYRELMKRLNDARA